MVICAVLALEQIGFGSARTILVGIAFDPRQPQGPGNPAVVNLPFGATFGSDPSCTIDQDPSKTLNGGQPFAECAIVLTAETTVGGTNDAIPVMFGVSFDPRSGFTKGGQAATSTQPFTGNPSCTTPRDNATAGGTGTSVICAIGTGFGNGFGTGTFNTLVAYAFNPVDRTDAPIEQSLGSAPSGVWTGVGCASQNNLSAHNRVVCAATTTTNAVFGVDFDPRTATRLSAAVSLAPRMARPFARVQAASP